jgi:hypothetical protein
VETSWPSPSRVMAKTAKAIMLSIKVKPLSFEILG